MQGRFRTSAFEAGIVITIFPICGLGPMLVTWNSALASACDARSPKAISSALLYFVGNACTVTSAVVGAVGIDERLDIQQGPVELSGSDDEVHGGIVSGPEDAPRKRALALYLGLFDFSPLSTGTVLRRSSPLYRWKVTRRDRAVASGRQAGRQRSSDRGIASEPDGWRRICRPGPSERPRLGPSRERNGTRRDRTRAPQRRRARRRREIARAPRREWRGSPGAALRSRRGERSQRPVRWVT